MYYDEVTLNYREQRSIIDMVASYMVHEDPVERAHASKFLEHSKIPHNLWSEPLVCIDNSITFQLIVIRLVVGFVGEVYRVGS